MAKQVQKPKPTQKHEGTVTSEEVKASAPQAREQLKDIDEILDEIDEVLIVNAEEFVKAFVQKGGE